MSIARRPSPDRNCRRARRAAASPTVVAILTRRSQEPPTDFNAKRQRPKDAKTITVDKSSIPDSPCLCAIDRTCTFWTQDFLLRSLSVLLFSVFGCGSSRCAFATWHLGVFTFTLKLRGPKCLFRVAVQLLPACHFDPHANPKTLKNTSNCCYLRLLAATCRSIHEHRDIPQTLRPTRRPTTAAHLITDFQQFALFSTFSTLFCDDRHLPHNTQLVATGPYTTRMKAPPLAKLFNY